MELKVHHIGIVVNDIDNAKKVYENTFDMQEMARFTVEAFKAEVCFIPVNNVYIELVKPLADDGLGKFLEKHGSGALHHICYIVDDMKKAAEYFTREKGLKIINGAPQEIPCFEQALFFQPADTGNVLVELVNGAACPLPIIAGGNP